jgi:hypothetical protein
VRRAPRAAAAGLAAGLAAALAACGGRRAAPAAAAGLPPAMAALRPVERAAAARALAERARAAPGPRTRAERSGYRETSRYADVVAFVDTLGRLAPGAVRAASAGATGEGRAIPLVVASRPAAATPEDARRLGRPVVYVQANIHAGEVEGKEALQMLLRDLALDPRPNALDSLVVVAVPIYNADGNERLRPQAVNRGEQNGPELVGQRPNARGLDLNRDYVKAEAPETRAALALLARWDPDVFVDLHTTDGSYHGYALTWSPSLHPSAPRGAFTRDTLLPLVQRRVAERWGLPTFPYGNFSLEYGADVSPDTARQGWFTYDHRPRFGTNYYGVRGRVAVLGEAYSHDPFERRVRATYAFVRELLSAVAEAGPAVRGAPPPAGDAAVALAARLTTRPDTAPVLSEDLARTADSARSEPGVPRGLRRTGRYRVLRLPVHDRFEATRTRRVPAGGWAFDAAAPGAAAAVTLLQRHGVRVARLEAPRDAAAEVYRADSVIAAPRPFQGHQEVRLAGAWRTEARRLAAGAFVVPADQPLAPLALLLLDPESDDGLVTWNVWDAALRPGGDFPVLRLATPAAGR